jgi:hypothetical protein
MCDEFPRTGGTRPGLRDSGMCGGFSPRRVVAVFDMREDRGQ